MKDNKYIYGREIIFKLRACHAISVEVYLHWLEKIDKEEQLTAPVDVEQREQLKGFVDWFNKTDKTQSILNERVEEYIETL
jgi:hypothetical protein